MFANVHVKSDEYLALYAHSVCLALGILQHIPPRADVDQMFPGIRIFYNKIGIIKDTNLWGSIGDLWTLTVRGLMGCLSKYPKLKDSLRSSNFGQLLKKRDWITANADLQNTLQQLQSQLFT